MAINNETAKNYNKIETISGTSGKGMSKVEYWAHTAKGPLLLQFKKQRLHQQNYSKEKTSDWQNYPLPHYMDLDPVQYLEYCTGCYRFFVTKS